MGENTENTRKRSWEKKFNFNTILALFFGNHSFPFCKSSFDFILK